MAGKPLIWLGKKNLGEWLLCGARQNGHTGQGTPGYSFMCVTPVETCKSDLASPRGFEPLLSP